MITKTKNLPNQVTYPEFVGERFQTLTVLEQVHKPDQHTRWWLCKCECGVLSTCSSAALQRLAIKRCSCRLGTDVIPKHNKLITKQCNFCQASFDTLLSKSGRVRKFCSVQCKNKQWNQTKGSPAAARLARYSGDTRTCKTCQLSLPYNNFHKSGKILKSGEKHYWYGNNCRMCEYEIQKPAKQVYYLKNKHFHKNTQLVANWRAKNAKKGKCQNCSQKLGFKARLCRNCYITHWIGQVAYSTKLNKWKDLPEQDLRQRVTILRQNRHVLSKLPGANEYPAKRLGHIVAVQKNPWGCLVATNIQWVKHKQRGKYAKDHNRTISAW